MRRLVLLLAALAALPAQGQELPRASDVVQWTARAEPGPRGGEARLVLDARVAPGWRLYAVGSPVGVPLTVALGTLPAGVEAGALRQSPTQRAFDPAFDADYTYFERRVRVVQPLRVARRARRGAHPVEASVRYAVCDDRICLAPATTTLRASVVVR